MITGKVSIIPQSTSSAADSSSSGVGRFAFAGVQWDLLLVKVTHPVLQILSYTMNSLIAAADFTSRFFRAMHVFTWRRVDQTIS